MDRKMTSEQAIQELFNRVQKLEAIAMAQNTVISMLNAIVASMPAGVGIDFINRELQSIRASMDPFTLNEETARIAEIYRDTIDSMIMKPTGEERKRSPFTVIDGDKRI